jgi:hypothetical protein
MISLEFRLAARLAFEQSEGDQSYAKDLSDALDAVRMLNLMLDYRDEAAEQYHRWDFKAKVAAGWRKAYEATGRPIPPSLMPTIVAANMSLEPIVAWAAPTKGMPRSVAEMFRERLCNFHAGQEFEQIPEATLMEHLQIVELCWSQGARPGNP